MAKNELVTKLKLDGSQWERGLNQAERKAKNFGRNLMKDIGGGVGLGAGGMLGAHGFFSTDVAETQRASNILGGGATGGGMLRAMDEAAGLLGGEGDGQSAQFVDAFQSAVQSAATGDASAAAALSRQGFLEDGRTLDSLSADPIAGLAEYMLNPPELDDMARKFEKRDFGALGLGDYYQLRRLGFDQKFAERVAAGETFTGPESQVLVDIISGLKQGPLSIARGAEHVGAAGTPRTFDTPFWRWFLGFGALPEDWDKLRPNE